MTFAFTDVVGSTRDFIEHGDRYAAAVTALHARTAEHAELAGGAVVETAGDGAFLAFPDATAAMSALLALQGELENMVGDGHHLRIRAGAHTGEAVPVAGHYLALPVYVAARVSATANAGQILVTDAVVEELAKDASSRISPPVDVGSFRLKDIPEPIRIWRIAGDGMPPRATPARRTNVQPSRTSFLGRGEELDRLLELVAEPRLVTVIGAGGVGKTRLVSELALRQAESIPGGMWLVELATLESPDQVVGTTAAAIGLPTSSPHDLALELAGRGRCVLVLDNCEHLLQPVSELVERLLVDCPELTVLCTSREALHIGGEHTWSLAPLAVDGAATDLFLERAEDAWRTQQDRVAIHELVSALDGLPLAIELAATQAGSAPVQEILAAVTSGADPLARRGGEHRQRSLDAVLDWSLDRLDASVRDSLLALSLFPGRFSPAMASSVLDAAPRCDPAATRRLASGSLIDLDGPDYRLLSTVRVTAQRRLVDDPDLHRQSLDALVQWAGTYGDERIAVSGSHDDVPDDTVLAIEVALRHALDNGATGLGAAWDLLFVVGVNRGATRVALGLAERALGTIPRDADSVHQLACAYLLLTMHGHRPELDEGRFETMLLIARDSADALLEYRTHSAAAHALESSQEFDKAQRHRSEVVVLTRKRPELRDRLGMALNNLAFNRTNAGDVVSGEEVLRESIAASMDAGQAAALALAHANLAEVLFHAHRLDEARDHALAALRAAPPSWRLRGWVAGVLAGAYAELGERDAALAAGRLALDNLRKRTEVDHGARQELADLLAILPELRAEAATPRAGRAPAR